MVAPDLEIVIRFATLAVNADGAGDKEAALARYTDAAGVLLEIIKVERDKEKAQKLAARMESYLNRAEALKAEVALEKKRAARAAAVVPPPAPAPPGSEASPRTAAAEKAKEARSRTSTGANYFTADDKFRSDVASGRKFCADVERRGAPYEDPTFRGNRALAHGGWDLPAANARAIKGWVRGGSLGGALFGPDGPSPRDVDQGALGDCWLLSSLSVLANFPELIRRLVWSADETGASRCGVYAARLCFAGDWRVVYVDDAVPARADGRPAFCGVRNGALWPAIVEKAAAKVYGCYAALDQGAAAEALGLLTGLPTVTMEKIHERRDLDRLHADLVRAYRSGFIVSASCGHCGLGKTPLEEEKIYDRVGLLNAHEYAVLRVVDVKGADGGVSARLLQLRNPWAKGEWRGPWSRHAPQWATLPAGVRAMLDDGRCLEADDGVFWMDLTDVAKYFHEITVCRLRRNFAQVRWPVGCPNSLDADNTPAFSVTCGAEATTLDACLIQKTERGVCPRGHHVMGDALFLVFAAPAATAAETDGTHAFTRRNLASGQAPLFKACVDGRPGLAPVVATGDLVLAPRSTYLLVPLCLNWRVLRVGSKNSLTAVLYSSKPLKAVTADGLTADALAAAVRAVCVAKGSMQGGTRADEEAIYELDGIYLVENRRPSSYLSVTIKLGNAKNLVSSRHGGVLDPSKPDHTYVVEDTLPPRTWQVVLARSPYRGSWAIQSTPISWQCNKHRGEQHAPPVAPSGFHACYPLD